MWATHGLAVALALSVVPGGRALRPGDCEGAGVWGTDRPGAGAAGNGLTPRRRRSRRPRPAPALALWGAASGVRVVVLVGPQGVRLGGHSESTSRPRPVSAATSRKQQGRAFVGLWVTLMPGASGVAAPCGRRRTPAMGGAAGRPGCSLVTAVPLASPSLCLLPGTVLPGPQRQRRHVLAGLYREGTGEVLPRSTRQREPAGE